MDSAADKAVIVSEEGGVASLVLNQPDTLNALTAEMKAGLEHEIPRLCSDPAIRVVLISGRGRAFCAGGDIRNMKDLDPSATRRRMQANHRWSQLMLESDTLFVGAIHGAIAGAGFSLALLCDLTVVADTARFVAGFPGIGAVPDLGIGYTLARAIGVPRAMDVLMTNRPITAAEALAAGMVSRVVPEADVLRTATELAKKLAAGPQPSLALTKRLVRGGFDDSLAGFHEREALAQAAAFSSPDMAEGVAAFLAKRKPVFGGAKG